MRSASYLCNKKCKKNAEASPEAGTSGVPSRKVKPKEQATTSSEDDSSSDSSSDDDSISIELTANLKKNIEKDFNYINSKNMLHILPAEPNVIHILELYLKHFAHKQMMIYAEKTATKYRRHNTRRPNQEDIYKIVATCREFLEGIRLYFDNTLNDILLYTVEKGIYPTSQSTYVSIAHMNPFGDHSKKMKSKSGGQGAQKKGVQNKSNASRDGNENKPSTSTAVASAPPVAFENISWNLLPEFAYHQRPAPPCLVYGATHLTRLIVKMPELLKASAVTEDNIIKLVDHMDRFINFLNDHNEWFGRKYYQKK